MVLEITTKSHRSPLISANGVYVILHDNPNHENVTAGEHRWDYFTQRPICQNENGQYFQPDILSVKALSSLQNELAGISIWKEANDLNILLYSARLSRPRIYFVIHDNSIFLSSDLRELLPFSNRQFNHEVAYGIIKFGETPEYDTIISDIKAVPAGCYILFNQFNLNEPLSKSFKLQNVTAYHKIRYNQTGGDIESTKGTLVELLSFLKQQNPALLVSGGIDSTLLNYLYNEVTDKPYDAYFFDFQEASNERHFVNESLKGTKAQLTPLLISSADLIEDFQQSVQDLISPVYDNGSALVGYIFKRKLTDLSRDNTSLIDGTLADSCYGVRDYNIKLVKGKEQPVFYSAFKEKLYQVLETNGIVLKTRPRDSYLRDEFLQDLLWYSGVYANTWFNDAKYFTDKLAKKYYWYLNLLDERNHDDYWARYTVLKMLLYAGKQTTVKVYDMLLPTQVYFPFMFKTILDDQGKYTWSEKSTDGIIKYPLKKILEQYASKEFIYRKKSGLQSQTRRWINESKFKEYALHLISQPGGVAESMMKKNVSALKREFKKAEPNNTILSLVLSIVVLQQWVNVNEVKIK